MFPADECDCPGCRTPALPNTRRCAGCHFPLPLGWFVRNGRARLTSRCRQCLRGKRRADKLARRARLAKVPRARVTEADVSALNARQGYRCACGCGGCTRFEYHVDHRVPLARGGAHELSNLQILTVLCNLRKGAR